MLANVFQTLKEQQSVDDYAFWHVGTFICNNEWLRAVWFIDGCKSILKLPLRHGNKSVKLFGPSWKKQRNQSQNHCEGIIMDVIYKP